ncbi:unnamed protein product, partial [Meganyctiphanes norvegica]
TMVGLSFPRCVVCNEEVDFHRHALCCDNCNRWQHRLCDSGISLKDYRSLANGEIEKVWHCAVCPAVNSRQSPQTLTKDIDVILDLKNKDTLTDLPVGWKKKTDGKSAGPNGKRVINYISPHGRKFRSKQQALEHCALHYQGLSPTISAEEREVFVTLHNLKYLAGTPSAITSKSYDAELGKNKSNSKITSTKEKDKNLQPFIRLHKIDNNSDKNEKVQPYVHLQRLSPLTILRETKQTKPYVQIDEISDDKRRELDANNLVKHKKKENANSKNSFVKEENNNKISRSKKKQQKLNTNKVKKGPRNGVMELKINRNKSPMKVRAQLKKHSMNISLKIDRKSLEIDQNHKVRLKDEESHKIKSSKKTWNLKLGTVKVKSKAKNVKNSTLKNTELQSDGSGYEMSVGTRYNQPSKLMSSAEDAELRKPYVRPLVWLHISQKDIEFGLIS